MLKTDPLHMAQAGIRMEWELSNETENPSNTDLGLGLNEPYISGDITSGFTTIFPDETRNLVDALPLEEGVIRVYLVNSLNNNPLLAGLSTVDNLVEVADKKYANKIFISAEKLKSAFTVTHELVHILGRAFHSIPNHPSIFAEEMETKTNCFYSSSSDPNDSSDIFGMKRLTDREIEKMRLSPLAK